MSWLTPCASCDDSESPILMFELCGGTGSNALTDTPYFVYVPVNPNGSIRGPLVYHNITTGASDTPPDAMTTCCCTILTAC